jgi:hypothetical protein
MPTKTLSQAVGRARRFTLHLRVMYREVGVQEWLEGWTENISRTGMLFRCDAPLPVDTVVELKLQLSPASGKEDHAAEVLCRGTVVRVEQVGGLDTSTVLAVSIHPYRIKRGNLPSRQILPFS